MSAAAAAPSGQRRVIFCAACGSIVDEPSYSGADVDCRMCGTTVSAAVFEDLVVRSVGAEHIVEADPDAVGAVQPKAQQGRVRAVVKEACPKCGHPELQYYTMQLRSADEGQTVFYECAKCGHTFSTNT